MPRNEYDDLLAGGQQQPDGNEYDALIRGENASQEGAMRRSIKSAVETTPDRAAQVIDLANRTKLPSAVVERNFDELNKRQQIEGNDYSRMVRQTPALSKWLEKTENAAIARDEVAKLGALEWLLTAPRRAWSRGRSQVEFGDLRSREVLGASLSEEDHRRLARLRNEMEYGGDLGVETWFGKALVGGAQQLPMLLGGIYEGAKTGAPMALTFGGAAALAGQVGPQVALPEEVISVPVAAATGYYIGQTTGAAMFGFRQEAGHAYEEFSKFKDENGQPLDPAVMRAAAIAAGSINAGLEAFQINVLLRSIPGADKLSGALTRQAVKRALAQPTVRQALQRMMLGYGKTMTQETATEVAQRAITIMSGELAKAASDGKFEYRTGTDIATDLAHEGIEAATSFAYIMAPGHAMRAGQDIRAAREAQKQVTFFQALGQGVQDAKLMQRLPEKMQEFVAEATKDGPIESIYIPVESWTTYWQGQGLDPEQVAQEVIGSKEGYQEAVRSGHDMRVPTAVYAVKIAATDHNQFFANEARLAPEMMNAREAVEFEQRAIAEQQAEQQAQAQQQQEAMQRVEEVREEMKQKLIAAGVEEQVADAYAQVNANAYRAIGQAAGMGAEELLAERLKNLTITRDGIELPTEFVFDQPRTTPYPATEEVQAKSKEIESAHGIRMFATSRGRDITLHDIVVPKEMRKQGIGSRAMEDLARYADQSGMRIILSPAVRDDNMGTTSRARLVKFYKRFGFVENKGRNKDFTIREGMYREPRPQQQIDERPGYMMVDGVERPMDNANDRPIAATRAGIEAFWRWFGDSKTVDKLGRPIVLYHGTTMDFTMFDRYYTNLGADWGRGFYFSNTEADVSSNYAGVGPDLEGKIENRIERLMNDDETMTREQADQIVRSELVAHGGMAMPVYLRMKNPLVIHDPVAVRNSTRASTGTFLDYNLESDEQGDFTGEETGSLVDFVVQLRLAAEELTASQAGSFKREIDRGVEKFIDNIMQVAIEREGISALSIYEIRNQTEELLDLTDDEGELIVNEVVRLAFERMGFDGVIDHAVDFKFGSQRDIGRPMEGMHPNTSHYIVFEPTQIKSAVGNRGTFSAGSENILHQDTIDGITGEVVPNEPFYSALVRQVEQSKIDKAPASQWKSYLLSLQQKGVKKDEIELSGVLNWLDLVGSGSIPDHPGNNATLTVEKRSLANVLMENGLDEVDSTRIVDGLIKGIETRDQLAFTPKQIKDALSTVGIEAVSERVQYALENTFINRRDLPVPGKNARVSRQDVLTYLQSNAVRVEEVPLGVPPTPATRVALTEQYQSQMPEGFYVEKREGIYLVRNASGKLYGHDQDMNAAIGEALEIRERELGNVDPLKNPPGLLPEGYKIMTLADAIQQKFVKDGEAATDFAYVVVNVDNEEAVAWDDDPMTAVHEAVQYWNENERGDGPTEEEINEKAQELLNEDLPEMARDYANDSEYVHGRFEVHVHVPDYQVIKVEGSGGMADLFTGREVKPHYKVVKLSFANEPNSVDVDASGNAREYFPDDANEFWEMYEEDVTRETVDIEFATEREAHKWAGENGLERDEPAWEPFDREEGRSPEGYYQEEEDFGDAVRQVESIREGRYESEVEYYMTDGAPSLDDFGDRYYIRAREELGDEQLDEFVSKVKGVTFPREPSFGKRARYEGEWQSVGGKDYFELPLYVPGIEPYGDSSHFRGETQGQAVAWMRGKVHTKVDVGDALSIEEFQSQRGQHGRERREEIVKMVAASRGISEEEAGKLVPQSAGFIGGGGVKADLHEDRAKMVAELDGLMARYRAYGISALISNASAVNNQEIGEGEIQGIDQMRAEITPEQAQEDVQRARFLSAEIRRVDALTSLELVPPAPFVADTQQWVSLLVKRALRWAVDQGLSAIFWTTGDQQVTRYKNWLREQIDKLEWSKDEDGINIKALERGNVKVERKATERELRNLVGVEMAQQIVNSPDQSGVIEGDNLTITDLGMVNFYGDEEGMNASGKPAIVPIVADRIARKLGGKGVEQLVGSISEKGVKGVVDYTKHQGIKITPEMAAKIKGGQALFQRTEGEKRGRIRFGQDRKFSIDLLQGADLSTFLHESGHFWLETLGDLVQQLRVGDQTKLDERQLRMIQDYDAVLQWFGVQDRSQITAEHHEKFARGFEAYLMEGKAPSIALRKVFARVRAWLLSIYRNLRNLNVDLTPEVRGVFDRLLATDEEINAAEAEAKIEPMFLDAAQAGMNEREFAAYRDRVQKASEVAREQLQAKLMRTLTREREAWWKSEREKEREDVEKIVHQRPEYVALAALTKGTQPNGDPLPGDLTRIKIDRKAVTDMLGENAWKLLPRGTTDTKDAVHPNTAAEVFGFASGEALLDALRQVRPMKQTIEAETDAVMRQKHGDMLTDGTLPDAAREAVQNEERVKIIEAELKALDRLRRASAPAVAAERAIAARGQAEGVRTVSAAVPPLSAVRRMAAGRIAAMRVREIQPNTYLVAARKLGQAAITAAAAGQYTEALTLKQRQLLNVELYRQSMQMREEIEKTVDYMQEFTQKPKRARIARAGQDYLDQIDGFLDRYDFARVSLKNLERRKNLVAWVAEKERNGETVSLPDDVVVETRINWKDMTVEELQGVRDSVKHIEHLSRLKNRLLTAKQNRDLQQVIGEIEQSIRANAKGEAKTTLEPRLPGESAMRFVRSWFASHRKLASLVRQMDGFKDGGKLWEYLVRPINEAGDKEAAMNAAATKALNKLFSVYRGKEMSALYTKQHIPAIGESLAKMGRIMVALNWGNQDNRQKLMDGRGWNESQVQAILDTLDERDWRFVQGVWDFIDAFWPEIAAKQRRVEGIEPGKVEASPVMTKYGEFAGGYFPLKYENLTHPRPAAHMIEDEAKAMMAGAHVRRTTKRGHTKERVEGVKLPVRLDFGVIFEHTTQVIHDLTHHEMLMDVNRVLRNEAVSKAIIEHYGSEVRDEFVGALQDIAAGDVVAQKTVERAINWTRKGTSIAFMGWNLMTSLLQPLGLSQSIVRIGPKWVGRGLMRWLRDSAGMENTVAWIVERSPFMAQRFRTQMREMNEIRNTIGLNSGRLEGWVEQIVSTATADKVTKQSITDSYFWLIGMAQRVADVPTWLGAYEKAMEEGNPEDRAVALADQAVLDSQGGGQQKDLASIQRGGPLLKLWTNFYSYFNVTYNLMAESTRRTSFKSPTQIGRLAVDFLMLYTVPATLGFLMREALRGDSGGDDEEFRKRLVAENLSAMLSSMILLREITSAVQGFAGYEGPAGARVFASLGKLVKQVQQGEADAAFWRSLNEVSGIIFHYPAGQVKRTAEGFDAMMDGRTKNPMSLIVGAPKE